MTNPAKVPWACPKCGATVVKHGRGGPGACQYRQSKSCMGFLCECLDNGEEGTDTATHGDSYLEPCRHANCYHCGWGGVFPKPPGKMPPWAKKAIEAGWMPPAGWAP